MIRRGSSYAGRPLGHTQMRTLTGASIVALLREGNVVGSPRPSEVLRVGDMVVIVGTDDGLAEAARILQSRL